MSLSDILAVIDGHVRPVKAEVILLLDAQGRVAARPLSAGRHVPPFDVSGLDGYAVRGPGVRFPVTGSLEPHGETPPALKRGEAVFVPTGGRIPRGSRFVAREHVMERSADIVVTDATDGRKTVKRGDWLKRGQRLVERGDVISPGAMGLLALAGHGTVTVFKKPPCAIITTGNELKKGSMADSNRFLLAGLIRRDGGEVVYLDVAADEEGEIKDSIARARASGAHLCILTGGTSRGKRDLTKQAVRRLGFRFLLDSPPIVPGKTAAFGEKASLFFFILPGPPGAVRSLYELLVKRALMRMAGRLPEETDCALPLTGQVEKPRDKVMVIPVRIGFHAAGIEEMYSSEPNGFIVLEEGVENVPAGQPVRVLGTCWHRRP